MTQRERQFRKIMLTQRMLFTRQSESPTTWDINNGMCDEFAMTVIDQMGGETDTLYLIWCDQLDQVDPPNHCLIFFDGKYYDAECLQGVENFHDIPVYKNCGRTREEVLRERGEWDNSTQDEAIRLYA